MFKSIKSKEHSFTLIELLVVIFIIILLATLAIVSFSGLRKNARDLKRIADIKKIQMSLELYLNDVGQYPSEIDKSIFYGDKIYLDIYPIAPNPPDGDCSEDDNYYTYIPLGPDNDSYVIYFCLGNSAGDLEAGPQEASPSGIVKGFVCGDNVIDIRDENIYSTTQIGDQCWMIENINYDDGCSLVNWTDHTDVGWCGCYNNNINNCDNYGLLYQWSVIMQGSVSPGDQGICPEGWHVPEYSEWVELADFLGGENIAGGKLKSVRTEPDLHPRWDSPNTDANDEFGFSALPAGLRFPKGDFKQLGGSGQFWSSSLIDDDVLDIHLDYQDSSLDFGNSSKSAGFSVRCLKN